MQQKQIPSPSPPDSPIPSNNIDANESNNANAAAITVIAPQELVSSTSQMTLSTGTSNNNSGMKIFFSVAKKKTTQLVAENKLTEKRTHDEEEDNEDGPSSSRKHGVLRLEDGVIVDSEAPQKKKKKVYIIPVLRLSNQAQIERLKKLVEDGIATDQDKARLTLLLESVGQMERNNQQADIGDERINLPISGAPTVVVPDEADPDYESMPVGEFGLAFLRGCGWKDQTSAIGKTNALAVPLRITTPRPTGLGLGAALPSAPPESGGADRTQAANGTQQPEEEVKPLGKSSYVKCSAGLKKGAYGQVMSMDEENSSVFVEISWPQNKMGKVVRMNQFNVLVVSAAEFRAKLRDGAVSRTENGRHKRVRV